MAPFFRPYAHTRGFLGRMDYRDENIVKALTDLPPDSQVKSKLDPIVQIHGAGDRGWPVCHSRPAFVGLEFVTTDAESILECSTQGERATGDWQGCASEQQKSTDCSKSLVAQPMETRSNCPSQVVLRSSPQPSKRP